MSDFKYCPYCGKNIASDMKFCPYCGKALPIKSSASSTSSSSSSSTNSAPKKEEDPMFAIDSYDGKLIRIKDKNISKVEIPDKVKIIDRYVFANCSYLREVTLPSSLIEIRDGAFSGCSSLEKINLPDKLEILGSSVFSGCSKLVNIEFGSNLRRVGNNCFERCSNITNISFPKSLIELGTSAFSKCERLNKVKLSSSLKRIEERTFADCTSIVEVSDIDGLTFIGESAFAGTKISSINLPSVEEISKNAFTNCKNLSNVSLKAVKRIGESAFIGCERLSSIYLPNSLQILGDSCFARTSISSITLPSYLQRLGSALVETKISSISLPRQIERNFSFSNCTYLRSVNLYNAKEIARECFYYCNSLSNIDIPSGVTKISAWAFSYSGVRSIKIPRNCTSIDQNAFDECSNLREFHIYPDYRGTYPSFNNSPNVTIYFEGTIEEAKKRRGITGALNLINAGRFKCTNGYFDRNVLNEVRKEWF